MRHLNIVLTYEGPTGDTYEVSRAMPLGSPASDREDAERLAKLAIEQMFEKGPGRG